MPPIEPPLYHLPPAWAGDYPVLGVTLHLECSDVAVGQALGAGFEDWNRLPQALRGDATVVVRVVVLNAPIGPDGAYGFVHQVIDPDRLFILAPGSVGCADVLRRDGIALVSPHVAGDARMLHAGMIEPLTLFLVSSLDRQPVHCAGLVRGGRLVLLAGPPGAGKSTMACAGLVRGWGVLAEDTVWVQQQPRFRVWGLTGAIKLPLNATRHFPQLGGRPLIPLPVRMGEESKVSVEVPLSSRPFPPVAHQGVIVLLERGPAPRLEPVGRETLLAELTSALQPGFDRFPDAIPAVVDGMGREGGWRLVTGTDPLEALGLLETLLVTSSEVGSPPQPL